MNRVTNVVFASMTTFIQVRIVNHLYIAMFLPNKLLLDYGYDAFSLGSHRQRMLRSAGVLIGADFLPCSSSLRENCFVLYACDLGLLKC